jgi:hypothetical protein
VLTVASRAITVATGLLIGLLNPPSNGNFALATLLIVPYAFLASLLQLRLTSLKKIQLVTVADLVVTVSVVMTSGGFRSPYVLTPITGLVLAGYVWGRRAVVGSAVAGCIAAGALILIQTANSTEPRGAAGPIAVIFLLSGALGAFTRNLVAEIEVQRAAAKDQATQMATANDLLVSLHALAQTLPASFDLGEVVESIRRSRTSGAACARCRPSPRV